MAFPVDLLDNCSHEELESSAEDYLSDLRCRDPHNPECLSLLNISIPISLSTVGFVPLYGGDQTHKILALFAPEDSLTAVALYLADQWWAIDDIIRTSVTSREGLQQVNSLGERVVLYVLNRIIYRKQEMDRNEIPFLCHNSTDFAKILWKKGEAVGFYSVKPTGSKCTSFLTQSYQLPVLDTMFVRKKHRGRDLGLLMLEDFVDSFTDDMLGLRYPLSSFMCTACKQYFEKYPGDYDLLWEIEGAGHWYQRTSITNALQRETLKITAEASQNETNEECVTAATPAYELGSGDNQPSEMQLTVDYLKGKDALLAHASTSRVSDVTPVSTRTRSSHLKRPKIGKKFQDSEPSTPQDEDENVPQTSSAASVSRLESNTYTSESSEEVIEEPEENVIEFEEETDDREQSDLETQGLCTSLPEKQDDKGESELEPVNGELTEDTIKSTLVTEEEAAGDVLDEETKLQPDHPNEESVTLLVPIIVESSKSPEDLAQDKGVRVPDAEMLVEENIVDEKESPEEKFSVAPRKKAPSEGADVTAALPNEEPSDNGLSNSVVTEASEESISENLSPNTTSSLEDQGEEVVPDPHEAPAVLSQSSLIVVELEDVPFQQNTGQKNQLEEQSEASSEQLEHFTQAAEKAADSSSEEIEVEVPVVDRRNLRRKAKGYKGPAKKKAKLA